MKDVPAFVEEDYMTARSNHISAINFELMEIKYFDGRIDKVTTEWKDAEQELRKHTEFGVQLKRGKDIVDDEVRQVIAGELDPLAKARKIYDFIKGWYQWNEVYGKYSEFGIKKAFDKKYIQSLDNRLERIEIKNAEIKNAEDIDKPLIQKLEIEIQAFDNPGTTNFLFNPFILGRWEENPFRSQERLYPVDFGTPLEMTTILNLEYPSEGMKFCRRSFTLNDKFGR